MGDVERWAARRSLHLVAGLDEAGRGPLAGPVVAACVVLPPGTDRRTLRGLDDSKRLSQDHRERLFDRIRDVALAAVTASASRAEIDEINILQASLLAMRRALEGAVGLVRPDLVAVDGRHPVATRLPQRAFVRGDGRSRNIAAASILAKVWRDRIMCTLHDMWPCYGFARHKGYPTADHVKRVAANGPCKVHRWTFAPIKYMPRLSSS